MWILIAVSVGSAIVGVVLLSGAPPGMAGIGALAVACLTAVFARMAQARRYHAELKRRMPPHALPPRPDLPDDPLSP